MYLFYLVFMILFYGEGNGLCRSRFVDEDLRLVIYLESVFS